MALATPSTIREYRLKQLGKEGLMSKDPKCRVCDNPTNGGLPECENCWEVERRLTDYVRSEKGKRFVLETLLLRCRTEDHIAQRG